MIVNKSKNINYRKGFNIIWFTNQSSGYLQQMDHSPLEMLNNLCVQESFNERKDELFNLFQVEDFSNFQKDLFGKCESENFKIFEDQEDGYGNLPLTLRKSRKYSCCQYSEQQMNALTRFEKMETEQDQKIIIFQPGALSVNNQSSPIDTQLREERDASHKYVFVQKQLKGLKKNTNVPKIIARIFMKHFKEFANQNDQALFTHHVKASQKLMNRSSNNFGILDVISLLRNQNDQTLSKKNQNILAQIIRQKFQEEIMENKYVELNRKTYMMALKIYSIRCRSKTLTERVQTF